MKTEDLERIKKLLGDEFTVQCRVEKDNVIVLVEKKDIWEGVEFFYQDGKVIKIDREDEHGFYWGNGNFTGRNYKGAKPLTEQAYIEQLKNEVFQRFGEIKEGQKFISVDGIEEYPDNEYPDFEYHKIDDTLYHKLIKIYQQGKWAVKLPERIEVKTSSTPIWKQNEFKGYDFNFWFRSINGGQNVDTRKVHDFLAKQLEDYLNRKDD